jgi:hypothetical protein
MAGVKGMHGKKKTIKGKKKLTAKKRVKKARK